MNNNLVLFCNSLSKNFGETRALENITLDIKRGEMFGLVGPDGAGKTTLIKIFCGVENKDSGELFIFDLDSDKKRREINKKLGYLSQRYSLYGDLTIDENIEFFARIHGVRQFQKRRDELLEFTRLTPFRNRLVDKLSGGMKQKTALACALIHEPELLVLDEPTNGVDPVSRREFWSILAELLKEGKTILISTPYLDEVERCSRVAILNKGKLIALDEPTNLKKMIEQNVYEIVCSPVRKAYHLIQEKFPYGEIQMFGDNVNIISGDSIESYLDFLKENGIEISEVRQKIPSIENVFIHLLRKEAKK
jgi:ABC-2 type transport system ATP-binding protein